MTVTAGLVPGQRPAPSPSPADADQAAGVPRLADGVELLGEYQGSGYAQPPSLVRRADGQVIQMSPLLNQVAGLRRSARIVVTARVACVIPLLAFMLGYLLLYLPAVNRALWQSASMSAHLMTAALAGHRYAVAAVDAIGVALAALSLAGSLYVVTGLVRRLTIAGLRWSAGHPGRRLPAAAAGLAALTGLAVFWAMQGQFHGW